MQSPQPQRPVMPSSHLLHGQVQNEWRPASAPQGYSQQPGTSYSNNASPYTSQQSSLQNVFESTADYMQQHVQAMSTVHPTKTQFTPTHKSSYSSDYTSVSITSPPSLRPSSHSQSTSPKKLVRAHHPISQPAEGPKYPYLSTSLPVTSASSPQLIPSGAMPPQTYSSHAGHGENVHFVLLRVVDNKH